ncbi:MAG: rRNA maturation RNase YbeY [Bacteroidales bacterium]
MIQFNFKMIPPIPLGIHYKMWIKAIIRSEGLVPGNIEYVFCHDSFLLEVNQHHLNHDTYTDIITFDYRDGDLVSGEIYISVDRIEENAAHFQVLWEEELWRVMAHGILHLCGYKDKNEKDAVVMREKENRAINLFVKEYKK